MSRVCAVLDGNAKIPPAKTCGRTRNYLRFSPKVLETARGIFPRKTAQYLSALTGNPVRTWEYWLSNERMSDEALATLIASDHGMEIIDVIAGQSPWWRAIRSALALADQQKQAMEEAANALRSLTQASQALRVQDVALPTDLPVAGRRVGQAKERGRR